MFINKMFLKKSSLTGTGEAFQDSKISAEHDFQPKPNKTKSAFLHIRWLALRNKIKGSNIAC